MGFNLSRMTGLLTRYMQVRKIQNGLISFDGYLQSENKHTSEVDHGSCEDIHIEGYGKDDVDILTLLSNALPHEDIADSYIVSQS